MRAGVQDVAGILAWIDGLGATGLDGHDLREMGLKNGNLIVDDQRNGKRWTFSRINVSLTRPEQGGVIFRLASEDPDRPWVISAAMRPLGDGLRAVGIEARHVSTRTFFWPCASTKAISTSTCRCRPACARKFSRRHAATAARSGAGGCGHHRRSRRRTFKREDRPCRCPIQLGPTPARPDHSISDPVGRQPVHLARGAGSARRSERRLAAQRGARRSGHRPGYFGLGRQARRRRLCPQSRGGTRAHRHAHHRIDLDQGDFSRIDTRPMQNVAVAVTGSFDYGGAEPHLAFGVAGTACRWR